MSSCFTFLRPLLLRPSGPAAVLLRPPGPVAVRLMSVAAGGQSPAPEAAEEYSLFVERLIPPTRVPVPPQRPGTSGWAPPAAVPPPLPYMVRRSRMHNIPVYTDISHGNRKTTVVRRVEGDIWALDAAVRELLKRVTGAERSTQVNEVTGSLRVRGHYDKEIKEWLLQQGF